MHTCTLSISVDSEREFYAAIPAGGVQPDVAGVQGLWQYDGRYARGVRVAIEHVVLGAHLGLEAEKTCKSVNN